MQSLKQLWENRRLAFILIAVGVIIAIGGIIYALVPDRPRYSDDQARVRIIQKIEANTGGNNVKINYLNYRGDGGRDPRKRFRSQSGCVGGILVSWRNGHLGALVVGQSTGMTSFVRLCVTTT